MTDSRTPILRVTDVSKSFGAVQALDHVGFELYPGEVHALMGENGAGKSTVAKIIAGIYSADEGVIELEGKKVQIPNPATAISLGIAIVMQELNSMPHLPVYENVFLGHSEIYKHGFVLNKAEAIRRTTELLAMFGMEEQINPLTPLRDLSVAEQQIVEIIKAVSYDSKVIILDEPTASLTQKEVDRLFAVVRHLKEQGVAFIIVSHRFNEIFEISDKITVFRDGVCVLQNGDMKEMDEQKLVHAMVGREIKEFFGDKEELGEEFEKKTMLTVEHLADSWDFIKDLSFEARTGEILGIAGLVGAGRTTLVRNIFGAEKRKNGTVKVDGVEIKAGKPGDAIKKGLSLVTENRKEEGVFLDFSICQNMAFAKTANGSSYVLPHKKEEQDCLNMIDKLRVKVGHYGNPAKSLSGGNQQKVVLGKWLLTNPKVLILDEPTRGIDISAKAEIYTILHQLVTQGVCIIIVSSELPEVLGICDRILVMKDGELTGELNAKEANEEIIMSYASFGAIKA
ncbi:MAG: sugar ABC transporter ATP-binding protein [Lachnospiraceae bacterium]|nr:sugar ABC transporter ATP-binding protein [Lachnospiraceae bacterium]